MFPDISGIQIYLKPGVTDMRKSIGTLSFVVEREMNLELFSKSIFLFCNRRRDIIKALYWDRNGFCLWEKKLEKDKFQWPESEEEVMETTDFKLKWLLRGIDLERTHKELKYSTVL
jgi:transposase